MRSFIVSDLDGTMLERNSTKLSPAVVKEIEKLVSKNHIFCVASGRSYVQLKKIFEPLRTVPIYFICCDGALCIYKEETLFSHPIKFSVSDSEQAIAYGKYEVYSNDKIVPFYRNVIKEYNGHVLPLKDADTKEVYKLVLKDSPLKEIQGLNRCLNKNNWQEYIASGVDKGYAVKKLRELLNVTKEQTVVLGDAENDISMAGLGHSVLIGKNQRLKKYFDAEATDFISAIQNL